MLSPPSLHAPVVTNAEDRRTAVERLRQIGAERPHFLEAMVAHDTIQIPLAVVSKDNSFDSFIYVRLRGAPVGSQPIELLVDSGNSTMVLPYWEHITALPDWEKTYTLVGEDRDPWDNDAKIVRGPIEIATADGRVLSIDDCTFYACTTDSGNAAYERTANFGTGCVTTWPTSTNGSTTLRPPLSLLADYPIAAFRYAPAPTLFSATGALNVSVGSMLTLYKTEPADVRWFDIIPDCLWMALVPEGLAIGATKTEWPGPQNDLIAMIDTGGTCAYLSDPDGLLAKGAWPDPVQIPDWATGSDACHAVSDPITITLGDAKGAIAIAIDTSALPASVQGLTLVMCRKCAYMMEKNGMNVGGITALFTTILIDYAGRRVGFSA